MTIRPNIASVVIEYPLSELIEDRFDRYAQLLFFSAALSGIGGLIFIVLAIVRSGMWLATPFLLIPLSICLLAYRTAQHLYNRAAVTVTSQKLIVTERPLNLSHFLAI